MTQDERRLYLIESCWRRTRATQMSKYRQTKRASGGCFAL